MSKDTMGRALTVLAEASSRLTVEMSREEFAKQLAQLAEQLEATAIELLAAEPERTEFSPQGRLYSRSLDDYAKLQQQLSSVRTLLIDRPLFVNTLKHKGGEIASMNVGLGFVRALDQCLGEIIHLMQYDIADRHEVDIRNGFQFNSGSMHYQRFNFAPSKTRK